MAEHTPGKWTWREIAPDDPEWGACEVWDGDTAVATHVCGVDRARLIAAAPAMADAMDSLRMHGTSDIAPGWIAVPAVEWEAAFRVLDAALGADASTEGGVE